MSFVKSILLFSVAGMLAGLGLSFVFPPRYTATATLVLTSDGTDPRSPQTVLDDYAEKALSAEKYPVRIAPVYRGTAHYAAVRISLKDSDRRQSVRTLNAFITLKTAVRQ